MVPIELFSVIRNSSCLELCLQMISVHLWSKSTYIWKEQSFYIFTQTSATALAIDSPKPLLCIWQEMDDKGRKAERNSSV